MGLPRPHAQRPRAPDRRGSRRLHRRRRPQPPGVPLAPSSSSSSSSPPVVYNHPMAAANPMRWVVLSFLAAGLFAIGIVLFVGHEVDQAKAEAAAHTGLVA